MTESDPVKVYGITECGQAMGVSRQRALQLHRAGKLPAPFAVADHRFFWLADEFDEFATARREALGESRG